MAKKKQNNGKLLEKIVTKMCSSIKDSKVEHNAKILGRLTRKKRQIDVLIKGKHGFLDVLVEVEAKDYKRPVSITQVEGFISKIKDTGANLGVMVCSKGFTAGARARAEADNIQLFEVFSDELKNTPYFIPVRMAIPEIQTFAVGFTHRAHGPFSMTSDLTRIRMIIDGKTLDIQQAIMHVWNTQKVPMEAGKHRVELGTVTLKDAGDPKFTQYCEIYFNVVVIEKYYLKIFPANFLKSVGNEKKQYFLDIPLFTDTKMLEQEWQQFSSLEEMNEAASIDDQPKDVQNLLIKPFFTTELDKATFDPNA